MNDRKRDTSTRIAFVSFAFHFPLGLFLCVLLHLQDAETTRIIKLEWTTCRALHSRSVFIREVNGIANAVFFLREMFATRFSQTGFVFMLVIYYFGRSFSK